MKTAEELVLELSASSGAQSFDVIARYVTVKLHAQACLVLIVLGDAPETLEVLSAFGLPEGAVHVGTRVTDSPRGLSLEAAADAASPAELAPEVLVKLWLQDNAGRPLGMIAIANEAPLPAEAELRDVLHGVLTRATEEMKTFHTLASLRAIVEATTPRVRSEIYCAVVDACVRVLGVDVAYVAAVDSSRRRARTLALREGLEFVSNLEYELAGTPCERIYETGESVYIPSNVQAQFPLDPYLRERDLESYLAIPLADSEHHVIGHLGLAHGRPLSTSTQSTELLHALASRAAAELEYGREEEARAIIERKLLGTQKLESLGLLAGGIAHDFNNLLVAILGNVSLARREIAPVSPIGSYLEEVEKAAQRAAELARQMLAYSGKGQFTMTPLDLSNLVEDMTNLLQVSSPKKVVIRYHLAPDLPAIMGDPTQLRQLVMNLVLNGAEAIGEKSGAVSVTTGLLQLDACALRALELGQDLREGEYACLEVADTGSGIDPDTLGKIFDPFFSTKATGRGLGLSAAQGIVRSHRGAIKVYSEPGRGTTFKLLFPVVDRQAVLLAQAVKAEDSPLPPGTSVLVADDEASVREVASRMLELLGVSVVQAEDGRRAVEVFREHADELSLVLLDMNMPHMNGAEVYGELRRLKPDVRVVLMSGYTEADATSVFADERLDGFMQKPFNFEDFQRVIQGALATGAGRSVLPPFTRGG